MNPKDRAGAKKPSLSNLPLAVLYQVSLALYEGARKYGPWNWRSESVDTMIYVDAAKRHLDWYTAHEDIDPDSGLHHVDKAIAGLMVLSDAIKHGCATDTRPPKQELDQAAMMQSMAEINAKYPLADECRIADHVTPVSGGPRYLTCEDVGLTVELSNGGFGEIVDWDGDDEVLPVKVQFEDDDNLLDGWFSTEGYYDGDRQTNDHNVVAVRERT